MKVTNEIEKKLKQYIQNNFIIDDFFTNNEEKIYYESELINSKQILSKQKKNYTFGTTTAKEINHYLNNELDKNNFQTTLFEFIDKTGEKDSSIYNKAFIDRRLFSKIRNDTNYHPSKNTVISLGIALKLNIDDFEKLLNSASYSLPKNNYFDLIIRFCIEQNIYNIIEINNYLDKYNCNTLN